MKILLGLVLAVATTAVAVEGAHAKGGKKPPAAKSAVDPNEELARDHGGKVWVTAEQLPAVEGSDLGKWLAAHSTSAELTQKPKDDKWPMNFIAVFKKAPAKGPMTVELVDKEDPKETVDQFSPQTPGASLVYQEGYDLDANNGFNKGHTYVIRVGQLIKGKFVVYATGEIALK